MCQVPQWNPSALEMSKSQATLAITAVSGPHRNQKSRSTELTTGNYGAVIHPSYLVTTFSSHSCAGLFNKRSSCLVPSTPLVLAAAESKSGSSPGRFGVTWPPSVAYAATASRFAFLRSRMNFFCARTSWRNQSDSTSFAAPFSIASL